MSAPATGRAEPQAPGRSPSGAVGVALLAAFAPAYLLASALGRTWGDQAWRWTGPAGRWLGLAAAGVGGALLVRRFVRDRDCAVAAWVVGPVLLVPVGIDELASDGWTWRLLLVAAGLGAALALGGTAVRWRRWRALGDLAGLVVSVLLPAAFIGLSEFDHGFHDWPCSSLNLHLQIHPWIRILALCLGVGLLTRAGQCWVRGRRRALAVVFTVCALVVHASAGYEVTRSGCGDQLLQRWSMLGPGETVDPGCQSVDGCRWRVAYDALGRPSLHREGAPPARLWAPAWLLQGGRAAVEQLARQDSPPLLAAPSGRPAGRVCQ